MATEVDEAIDRARASLERVSDAYRQGTGRDRRVRAIGRRLTIIAAVDMAIVLIAIGIGLLTPIGMIGFFGLLIAMALATVLLAVWPVERAPAPEKLRDVPIKALPAQTGRWLEAQRPALPAPAITLADQIGLQLNALAPQLATLSDDAPAAAEIRKLVGEQLPEFVKGYQRVPAGLRAAPAGGVGKSPDAELVDGLRLIEREIAEASARLAQGDLDALATRGRFLEIKYRGDDGAAPAPTLPDR